jgi:hypothetical protein
MTPEPQPVLVCPKCLATDVRSAMSHGHMMQHHCRRCFHSWELSLLNDFPSERDLQAVANLEKRSR